MTVKLPAAFRGTRIPGVEGQGVILDGSFWFFEEKQLSQLALESDARRVKAIGPDVARVYHTNLGNSHLLRAAIEQGIEVRSEGQLFLDLLGKSEWKPMAENMPSGDNIATTKKPLEAGEVTIAVPEGVAGTLTMQWKIVKFPVEVRFSELFGHFYALSDFKKQRWGQLFYNGEPLNPAPLFGDDGAETFVSDPLWEDGNETDQTVRFVSSGAHGFNASRMYDVLTRPNFVWVGGRPGTSSEAHEVTDSAEVAGSGMMLGATQFENLRINFTEGTYAIEHGCMPRLIRT